MSKWKKNKVKDVIIKIQTGTTPRKNIKRYYENGILNWFSPSDFDENTKYLEEAKNKLSKDTITENKARIFDKNTLLMVGIGTVGKIGLLKKESSSNQQITGLNFKDFIIPEYAYYWFRYIRPLIEYQSSSAVLSIINQKSIKELPFFYPSRKEQHCIVSKLDKLFAEIDASLALIDENIEKAEALKLSVLDEEFINDNFEKVSFLKYIQDKSKKIKPDLAKTYNIIGLENIETYSGRLIDFSPKKGSESISTKAVFKKGDVLYGKLRPYLNKVYTADFEGIASTEIIPFTPDKDRFVNYYVAYYLRSETVVQQVNLSCSGARMPRVKKKFWKELEIPMPSIKYQGEMVERMDRVFKNINNLIQEYTTKRNNLDALKSSLLDSAFKGELY